MLAAFVLSACERAAECVGGRRAFAHSGAWTCIVLDAFAMHCEGTFAGSISRKRSGTQNPRGRSAQPLLCGDTCPATTQG